MPVKVYGEWSPKYVEQYAIFGEERTANGEYTFRYSLSRTWDHSLPKMLTILLNPSTADQNNADPTNTRGEMRAREYGYGANIFVNLFACRTPSPAVMKKFIDPVGPENDTVILSEIAKADLVLLGWGTHGNHMGRDIEVLDMLRANDIELMALDVTKHGHPKHILYVPYSKTPKPYERKQNDG